MHDRPVPTLGGLAIAAAVLGVVWIARWLPGYAQTLEPRPLWGLTYAALVILGLGVVDDLKRLSPWIKLSGQVLAALVLASFGFGIPFVTNPFGGQFATGFMDGPLTVLWVLGVMNAINLIDGLDGLASGVVLIASLTLWYVGRAHGDFYVMFFASPAIGATLGFLRFNFPPARVFMGDTGSQFLGLLLAAMSLLENRKGTATITLLFPLVAMGLPIADGLLAVTRRATHGHPVFRGDSEHIHHRLLRLGLSPRRTLLILWCLSAALGITAALVAALPHAYGWLFLLLLGFGLVFAFEVIDFIDRTRGARPPA
ncbi:MAG: undecaprenyl/decaprenyl-phosphate alpha-N-acetylglucosaminyl 1-phosphate transferase [Candidatus Eisenbacteria bacterium]|uniref:Undecaprenyl/decaprenyl-phosphate alpha-N-acetylglucosaminyl 1-phosphate transferase n=1 Tax=Eiseniibacteriota bacterium TaxID=2212470 RepID=A0A538TV03_UNCEI|nr:MAG: undecaprenyl/decaprenyl-phosphate alpha-N-acetylglucosaminyl 1-phosphate transferase [Candidatus Eisenbacteria bacterium]